jgi:hypothetical protein
MRPGWRSRAFRSLPDWRPCWWLYAENDKYFGPAASKAWFGDFQRGGGKGRYVLNAPHGNDGHQLFYAPDGITVWPPVVQAFLRDAGF